jgi:hypothetical protein
MTTTICRWNHGTALSTTLAACIAAAITLAPRAAHADAQTVKLIQLLIQKGILSPGQAKDLLKETSAPTKAAHALGLHEGDRVGLSEGTEPPAVPGNQIRVTYVPQFIRKQIADEVRSEVMTEAQDEHWAAPDALPDWTKRIKIDGDVRFRYLGDMFDQNNGNQFINFNAINNGSAFDANNYGVNAANQANPPFLNTTEDRNRFRLRARIGFTAEVTDWVTARIRLGTGQDDGPVSPNETLGSTNGSLGASGDFSKPSIYLDRAYIELKPLQDLNFYFGRFANPFLPSDLMFYQDLGFDGAAAKGHVDVADGVTVFGTAGGFPLFNTSFDFSTNSETKYASRDSYLAAIQGGVDWQINPVLKAELGVGLFDFLGVSGAVSSPCYEQPDAQYYCDTDNTRTPFEQFGNTLFPIRNIIPAGGAVPTTAPDPQYYGLASRFNVLDIHPRLEILTYPAVPIVLEGQFIKNLAFDRNAIVNHGPPLEAPGPVNNLGPNGHYEGGDTGYMLKATFGKPTYDDIKNLWDWQSFISYRYLETDATLDAIADADFHEGGTNAQGYILSGAMGVAHNTWVQVRYMSAEAISGQHYGTTQIYVDLNARF